MKELINIGLELFTKDWFYTQFLPLIFIVNLIIAIIWQIVEDRNLNK